MNRRELLRCSSAGLLALASVPLLNPLRVRAEDLPHVSKDDPTAKTLKYTDDATQSERKSPDAFCHTCRFFKGTASEPWAPCELFPGKTVNAKGWCSMWTKKS